MRFIFIPLITIVSTVLFTVYAQYPPDQEVMADIDELENQSTLNDAYTLGRIAGSRATYNLTVPLFEESEFIFLNAFHHSVGTDNRNAYGFSSVQALGLGDAFMLLFMVPEFDLALAPVPSHRIAATIMPLNLIFVAGEGDAATGFELPFVMMNTYSWDFLTNSGSIKVSADQNENSFFFGPQLNPGQIRLGADFAHPIMFESGVIPAVLGGALEFGIGLPGNISNNSSFSFSQVMDDHYSTFDYEIDDSVAVATAFDWRTPFTTVQAGYQFLQEGYKEHIIGLTGTFLSGPHTTSFSEVNGNWDGTFSPLLHARQFMALLHGSYGITEPSSFLRFENTFKYGVTEIFTIGYEGSFTIWEDRDPYFVAIPGIHLSNIARRTHGPAQVTPFEYRFGYWPRVGEYRLDIRYKLPLNDPPMRSSEYPLYEYLNTDYMSNLFNLISMNTTFDDVFRRDATHPQEGLLNNYDGQVHFSAGLAANVNIFNTFNMRTVRVYSSSSYTLESQEDNFVYSNQFGMAFGNPQYSLFTLMFGVFGQTRKSAEDKEKFDFMVSLLYTASL